MIFTEEDMYGRSTDGKEEFKFPAGSRPFVSWRLSVSSSALSSVAKTPSLTWFSIFSYYLKPNAGVRGTASVLGGLVKVGLKQPPARRLPGQGLPQVAPVQRILGSWWTSIRRRCTSRWTRGGVSRDLVRTPEHLRRPLLPHAGVALQVLIQPGKKVDEASMSEISYIYLEDIFLMQKDMFIASTQLSMAWGYESTAISQSLFWLWQYFR